MQTPETLTQKLKAHQKTRPLVASFLATDQIQALIKDLITKIFIHGITESEFLIAALKELQRRSSQEPKIKLYFQDLARQLYGLIIRFESVLGATPDAKDLEKYHAFISCLQQISTEIFSSALIYKLGWRRKFANMLPSPEEQINLGLLLRYNPQSHVDYWLVTYVNADRTYRIIALRLVVDRIMSLLTGDERSNAEKTASIKLLRETHQIIVLLSKYMSDTNLDFVLQLLNAIYRTETCQPWNKLQLHLSAATLKNITESFHAIAPELIEVFLEYYPRLIIELAVPHTKQACFNADADQEQGAITKTSPEERQAILDNLALIYAMLTVEQRQAIYQALFAKLMFFRRIGDYRLTKDVFNFIEKVASSLPADSFAKIIESLHEIIYDQKSAVVPFRTFIFLLNQRAKFSAEQTTAICQMVIFLLYKRGTPNPWHAIKVIDCIMAPYIDLFKDSIPTLDFAQIAITDKADVDIAGSQAGNILPYLTQTQLRGFFYLLLDCARQAGLSLERKNWMTNCLHATLLRCQSEVRAAIYHDARGAISDPDSNDIDVLRNFQILCLFIKPDLILNTEDLDTSINAFMARFSKDELLVLDGRLAMLREVITSAWPYFSADQQLRYCTVLSDVFYRLCTRLSDLRIALEMQAAQADDIKDKIQEHVEILVRNCSRMVLLMTTPQFNHEINLLRLVKALYLSEAYKVNSFNQFMGAIFAKLDPKMVEDFFYLLQQNAEFYQILQSNAVVTALAANFANLHAIGQKVLVAKALESIARGSIHSSSFRLVPNFVLAQVQRLSAEQREEFLNIVFCNNLRGIVFEQGIDLLCDTLIATELQLSDVQIAQLSAQIRDRSYMRVDPEHPDGAYRLEDLSSLLRLQAITGKAVIEPPETHVSVFVAGLDSLQSQAVVVDRGKRARLG